MSFILPGGIGQIKPGVGFSAFDPLHNATNITLSNNNRTATISGVGGTFGGVRGVKSHNSGKFYCEFTAVTVNTSNASRTGVGVCNSSFPTNTSNTMGNDAAGNSWAIVDGTIYFTYHSAAVSGNWAVTPTAGDILMVAVDFSGSIYLGVNNTWVAAAGPFNAATPDFTFTAGTVLFPGCSLDVDTSTVPSSMTFNSGGVAFAFAPPTGFLAWG